MPVPEAEFYIPEGNDFTKAFDTVKRRHPQAAAVNAAEARRADLTSLQRAAGDYFTAGVAFLANRGHDDLIQEIGTTSWRSVNKQSTLPILSNNILGTAMSVGVPLGSALRIRSKESEPHVLFIGRKEGIQIIESAYVIIPPEFISTANNEPIQALASMTWVCSQVRDLENGRLTIDAPNFQSRAEAMEAHFLVEATKRHPDFSIPGNLKDLVREYPQGALSLPRRLRYNTPQMGGSPERN